MNAVFPAAMASSPSRHRICENERIPLEFSLTAGRHRGMADGVYDAFSPGIG